MSKWIAEFELEDGDTMPEHMDLEYMGAKIDFHCKPLEPIEKCKWIKYDYRTMCPKEHIDVDKPYWRIPENRMETLKYCPYCGKEIEVDK